MDAFVKRFGPDVHVAASPMVFGERDLLPEEKALCTKAVEKRKRELAAGRVLARRLLAELGVPQAPLLRGEDRAPLWPHGVVGSISHSSDLCVVAVSKKHRSLGVDVEEKKPLEWNLFGLVLLPLETRWLARQPASERGDLAKLIFSAKECVYKAQFPLTKKTLEFTDVQIDIDETTRTFRANVLPDAAGFYELEGRHILTGMVVV